MFGWILSAFDRYAFCSFFKPIKFNGNYLFSGKPLAVSRDREPVDEDNAPSYLSQHTVLPASWSYLLPFHNRAHSINFLIPPPYHPSRVKTQPAAELSQQDTMQNNKNLSHLATKLPLFNSTAMDLDIHSVMATELLEEAKDSGMSDSSGGGSTYGGDRTHSTTSSAKMEAKNEEVLRRVQEMQKMVENSEQYLNEQGELVQDFSISSSSATNAHFNNNHSNWNSPSAALSCSNVNSTACVIEFDSDCDSLNSSKQSSNDETPQANSIKHSDSLVLLAETINQDLSGINQSLSSIGGSDMQHQQQLQKDIQRPKKPCLSNTSSPRPERKVNGFSQLLSNLQALGTDFSQSESDSESIASPTQSPTTRRPSLLNTNDKSSRKQNMAYRSSFGLHSPDSNNFGLETKDYNLKEYLKQLKEISNVDNLNPDTDVAAKKLSEIYGFEIREDTFIETDSDLIDLRAIPPPQTPDELDALSLLNAAPHGFGDTMQANRKDGQDQDLDRFLEKVVVAPPTQKATPAKELTPEEIMQFIIPPPPNLDEITEQQQQSANGKFRAQVAKTEETELIESLYSNSAELTRGRELKQQQINHHKVENTGHVIEYATVERKSKFSCCPKSKKTTEEESFTASDEVDNVQLKLPPRTQSTDQPLPARPPKSAELLQRYSPKKGVLCSSPPPPASPAAPIAAERNALRLDDNVPPPMLPPRCSFNTSPRQEERPMVSPAPKKPPLPPIATRPILRKSPLPMNYPMMAKDIKTTPTTPPPMQPRIYSSPNNSAMNSPILTPNSQQNAPAIPLKQPHFNNYQHSTIDYRDHQRPPPPYPLLYSPQMTRKMHNASPILQQQQHGSPNAAMPIITGGKLIIKNGHVIDAEALLLKTDVAMAGLLIKLDQVAAQCTAAQAAGGGSSIDEDKFQRARNELTEQTLVLVTASKFLVVAMSDMTLSTLPEHLTSCLTAIRRITELTQDMTRHTSAPLQTRNIVLKVHDVASSFRELVGVQIGPMGAGQLALQAECLANVLATLLRSLRVFSP